MKLTDNQERILKDNMGLVGKVIKDKVHNPNDIPGYAYEDLFQIGLIGLYKAVATDKGGTFSTYAYRLIWNEICDALIHSSRKYSKEESTDDVKQAIMSGTYETDTYDKVEIYNILNKAKSSAPPSTAMGIDALILSSRGYTAKDIGKHYGKSANTITALISKARKHLKGIPELYYLYAI